MEQKIGDIHSRKRGGCEVAMRVGFQIIYLNGHTLFVAKIVSQNDLLNFQCNT